MCDNARIRMNNIIKLLNNRLDQIFIALIEMYFVYTTVDFSRIVSRISRIPLWVGFVVILYSFIVNFLAVIRWGLILFGKLEFKNLWIMYKASMVASFYSMFLPTPLAGDGLKWVRSAAAFGEIPKSTILATILVDRVVGLSTLVCMAGVAMVLSMVSGNNVPFYIKSIVLGMCLGVVTIGLFIYFFDLEKMAKKFKFLSKFAKVESAFRTVDKTNLLKAVLVSIFAQILWVAPAWFLSAWFVPGHPVLVIYTYIPIISLMLALPVSFGGFGAREAAYSLFFSPLGYSVESLLAMSAYMGVVQLISALISGIFIAI